ncbi:MAG: hypothetical protein PHR00_02965 [Patescibacteria group bacterium]|nr:hypothetical protein [Patescibacteria group bacterium]
MNKLFIQLFISKNNQARKGYVVLTSVIIVCALAMSIAIAVATKALSGQKTINIYEQSEKTRLAASACAEYGLSALMADLNYRGDESIIIDSDVSCHVNLISGFGRTNRNIGAYSTIITDTGAYTRKIAISQISDLFPVPLIGQWLNLSDF